MTYDEASATFYLPSSYTANESLCGMAQFDTEMFITAERRAPSREFKNRII
jgi:hypothetical protein